MAAEKAFIWVHLGEVREGLRGTGPLRFEMGVVVTGANDMLLR